MPNVLLFLIVEKGKSWFGLTAMLDYLQNTIRIRQIIPQRIYSKFLLEQDDTWYYVYDVNQMSSYSMFMLVSGVINNHA